MSSQGRVKISELQVNPEYETLLPLLLDEDLKNLEKSILKDGILHPFITNPDKVVLDGHHRLLICQRHFINEVPFIERSFNTDLEEEEFVISFNLNRRHLTTTQKVELGMTIDKIEMEKARRRQLSTLPKKGTKGFTNVPSKLKEHSEEQGEATEIAAKKVGLGKITFWKGKRIAEAAQTDKRAHTAWRDIADGNRSIDSVYQELFHQEKPPTSSPSRSSPARSSPAPKLKGEFQVVVVDPYRFKLDALKRMSIPFDEKGCVLWLWIPLKSFCDAFSLIRHWGFQLQTMLTWVKNKKGHGKWLHNQTEHCLLATKGRPRLSLTFQATVLIASPSPHHPKPNDFFFLASSLTPGARKLSVFYSHPDWHGPLEVKIP